MEQLLTIVIPCYNEGSNISEFFPRLLRFAEERNYKVIAVNDGSSDSTGGLLAEMAAKASCLRTLTHKCNRGYGAAIKTGLWAVDTPYAITIDADGQHRLEDVDKCFAHISDTNADLVVGARTNNASGGYRSFGKRLIRAFAETLLELPVKDLNSGMKCYRMSEAYSYLELCPDTMAFSDVILLLMVNDRKLVSETAIEVAPRISGKSTIGTRTALVTVAEILNLAILLRPLTVFFRIGLFFVLSGLAWGGYVYFKSRLITSAAVMLLTLGMLSFMLGLLGEQLSQIRRRLAQTGRRG